MMTAVITRCWYILWCGVSPSTVGQQVRERTGGSCASKYPMRDQVNGQRFAATSEAYILAGFCDLGSSTYRVPRIHNLLPLTV